MKKLLLKKIFKRKNIPLFIVGLFVLGIFVSVIYSSSTQKNDWYLSKSLFFNLQKTEKMSINNLTYQSSANEDYYFKIVKVGYGLITTELDYPPSSTLATVMSQLTIMPQLGNQTTPNLYTQSLFLPDAIVNTFFAVPIIVDDKLVSVELVVFPPIVLKPEWENLQSQANNLKEQLLAKFLLAPGTLKVVTGREIKINYSTNLYHPSQSTITGNLTLTISYYFTRGGTLKHFSMEKNVIYSNGDYNYSKTLMIKKSLLWAFLQTPRGVVILSFTLLVFFSLSSLLLFRKIRSSKSRRIIKNSAK